MKNELIQLATHLDGKGLYGEANYLDAIIKRAGKEGLVRSIQELLNENHDAGLNPDDDWGPLTSEALASALGENTELPKFPSDDQLESFVQLLQEANPSGSTPIAFNQPSQELEVGLAESPLITARSGAPIRTPEGVKLYARRINQMYNDIGTLYNKAVQLVRTSDDSIREYGDRGVPYPQLDVRMALTEEGMEGDAVAMVEELSGFNTVASFSSNALIKLATHLDNKGLHAEADYLDAVIKRG